MEYLVRPRAIVREESARVAVDYSTRDCLTCKICKVFTKTAGHLFHRGIDPWYSELSSNLIFRCLAMWEIQITDEYE